jgi:hypothetical protein
LFYILHESFSLNMLMAFVGNKPNDHHRFLSIVRFLVVTDPFFFQNVVDHFFGYESAIGIVPAAAQVNLFLGINTGNLMRTGNACTGYYQGHNGQVNVLHHIILKGV